jgi:gamma-glutamylcyclotransferase (GGCT)/AIG2-like uncharacterized protein YtfP
MIQRLFVYGTLIPGGPNEYVLGAIGGTWQKAVIRGRLKSQGWGADMGYPGIVLDDAGDEIQGYLFSSDAFADRVCSTAWLQAPRQNQDRDKEVKEKQICPLYPRRLSVSV